MCTRGSSTGAAAIDNQSGEAINGLLVVVLHFEPASLVQHTVAMLIQLEGLPITSKLYHGFASGGVRQAMTSTMPFGCSVDLARASTMIRTTARLVIVLLGMEVAPVNECCVIGVNDWMILGIRAIIF